jgi:hypothetical protein
MDSIKRGTSGTAGPANDDGLSCYNGGQVGHIARNCPNRDLMKKLHEHALVIKDAPTPNSGRPRQFKTSAGELTGRNQSGWLAAETEDKQEKDSEAKRQLQSHSDLDPEAVKFQGGQQLRLCLP